MSGGTAGPQRVCLLLADLSGYTEYVAASEPEHAPTMAGDLVEAVVQQLRPAFSLEKLEGDAAFLLAPLGDLDGTQLLDAIDAAYDAFNRRVESLRQGTTCDCESCRRVPDLDLKFIVHAGTVTRHRVAGRQEVGGHGCDPGASAAEGQHAGRARPEPLRPPDRRLPRGAELERNAVNGQAAIESFEFLGEIPVHVLPLGADATRRTGALRPTAGRWPRRSSSCPPHP